jgi:hypothetical protein
MKIELITAKISRSVNPSGIESANGYGAVPS